MEQRLASIRKSAPSRARGRGPHVSLERRLHPRRPAVDYRVWAGGWLPDGAFATVAARVEDISRGGARIVTPIEFAEGESLWLRLGNPSCDVCVRADVLEAGIAPNGDRFARLRFREDCPESFHRIVTRGLLG